MNQWLDEYGQSHKNKRNKLIHWVCVPTIFFTLLALLSSVHIPLFEPLLTPTFSNLASLAIFFGLLFYLRLSTSMFIGMGIFTFICYLGIIHLNDYPHKIELCLGLFTLAWIGQFIGHKIEGKKPSFLKDIQFLLIGPAWLLSFIYKKCGIKI